MSHDKAVSSSADPQQRSAYTPRSWYTAPILLVRVIVLAKFMTSALRPVTRSLGHVWNYGVLAVLVARTNKPVKQNPIYTSILYHDMWKCIAFSLAGRSRYNRAFAAHVMRKINRVRKLGWLDLRFQRPGRKATTLYLLSSQPSASPQQPLTTTTIAHLKQCQAASSRTPARRSRV